MTPEEKKEDNKRIHENKKKKKKDKKQRRQEKKEREKEESASSPSAPSRREDVKARGSGSSRREEPNESEGDESDFTGTSQQVSDAQETSKQKADRKRRERQRADQIAREGDDDDEDEDEYDDEEDEYSSDDAESKKMTCRINRDRKTEERRRSDTHVSRKEREEIISDRRISKTRRSSASSTPPPAQRDAPTPHSRTPRRSKLPRGANVQDAMREQSNASTRTDMDISPTATFAPHGHKRRGDPWLQTEQEQEEEDKNRRIALMRDLDGATTNYGFCRETGFDINGVKGFDAYADYSWGPRFPFDRARYERRLARRIALAEAEGTESWRERINRILKELEKAPRKFKASVWNTDSEQDDTDKELEEQRRKKYVDVEKVAKAKAARAKPPPAKNPPATATIGPATYTILQLGKILYDCKINGLDVPLDVHAQCQRAPNQHRDALKVVERLEKQEWERKHAENQAGMEVDQENRQKRVRLEERATNIGEWSVAIEGELDTMNESLNTLQNRTDAQEQRIQTVTKRVDIVEARLSTLTFKEIEVQRRAVATKLTSRGWWIDALRKLAPEKWRDESISWVLQQIKIDPASVHREHTSPGRNMPREWTLLTFANTDDRENYKRYINWTSRAGGTGIPIWNADTQQPVPNTRMIWETYLCDWDKMATIPLKTCFEALRADDCFWIGENCTLRENITN